MRDKIIEDYKILLAIGWMEADEDGNVSVRLGDELMPATIGGKRVILPTRAQLKNTNWDNRIGFHPIREQYNLGVSDLLSCLRDQYVSRLNATIGYFMKELINIAYVQENQKKLTSEQSQVLNALSKVSATTVKSFASILKNTSARNNADQFISIRIQRAGVVGGVTYGRAGLVQFPIYEKLKGPKDEQVNGVTLSDKDRNMLIKLYEFVLPSITTGPEAFCVGVSSRGAPFLEALVRSTFNVVSELVERTAPYMDLVALPSLLQFPKDMGYWIEVFDSKDMVERLSATIPNMNEFTIEEEVASAPKAESRQEYRKPVEERATTPPASSAPEKRSFWGNGSGGGTIKPTTSSQDRSVHAPRVTPTVSENQSERARREELDRERRERDRLEENRRRQEEAERRREDEEVRRQRDEEDRLRERSRRDRGRDDRDSDRGRDRDRDYDRRDDRDDRDRDRDRKTGDVFEDNPLLRENTRRDSRDDRYDRDRGRSSVRVRDIRDRGRDDRDYDRRDDRDDRYYDRDRRR